jgi:hypothetical protein
LGRKKNSREAAHPEVTHDEPELTDDEKAQLNSAIEQYGERWIRQLPDDEKASWPGRWFTKELPRIRPLLLAELRQRPSVGRPKITDAQQAEIRRLRAEDKSIKEIVHAVGVSRASVIRYSKKGGSK